MVLLDSLVYEEPSESWREELWKAIKGDDVKGALATGGTAIVTTAVITVVGKILKDIFFPDKPKPTPPPPSCSLVILGMPEAGKTQFWKNLKGERYTAYETTNAEQEYQPFDYVYGNRKIRINAGKDIGGSKFNIKPYWEDLMKTSDIAIFIFDVSKYLTDADYQGQVNARLDFFYRHVGQRKYAVIASHADKMSHGKPGEQATLVQQVQSLLEGKKYAPLFYRNFWTCNLTDPQDFRIITEKLFANV